MDVAIVGVGLHPFGRFGERTGIQMGAMAIRSALAVAGVAWRDIQFAFAGSYEIDNPDAVIHSPWRPIEETTGRKVGYTQLYGAPGVAGVSILSV